MTRFRERYEEIYTLLTRTELQQGSAGLDALSALPDLFGQDDELWLGFYTEDGLRIALEKYGFMRDLERIGFRDRRLELRTDDPDEHLLRIWSDKPHCDAPLVELVVRRDFLQAPGLGDQPTTHIPVLNIEWLLLQNPATDFSPERPPLPGQRYPGLGVGPQVMELLRNVCQRLELGALVTVPSYFHNAIFYSEEFRHFDPYWQGAFLALCRDVMPQAEGSVAASSWGLYWEMVENKNAPKKQPFDWFQQLMVYPISERLRAYFDTRDYQREVQQGLSDHDFLLHTEPLTQTLAARGISPLNNERIDVWIDDV
ncbi:hypothetical protein EA187_10270 [Lujinxingia sediminis]|uniref:Uncharacterized protein n=1 Tax=Lujinxingia sediminis TaxID=2480984 RepID=A0ABY0CTX7_9DELT|nr:hypothetical protein [Lujinxingia sediminis]RVU44913.1 hypothetical protein EA187_10270 [Lujinxingia sediminis]